MDPYELIGASPNDDDLKLKKAYRTKARKLHPDLNQSPGANDQMTELNLAWEKIGEDIKERKKTPEVIETYEDLQRESEAQEQRANQPPIQTSPASERFRRESQEAPQNSGDQPENPKPRPVENIRPTSSFAGALRNSTSMYRRNSTLNDPALEARRKHDIERFNMNRSRFEITLMPKDVKDISYGLGDLNLIRNFLVHNESVKEAINTSDGLYKNYQERERAREEIYNKLVQQTKYLMQLYLNRNVYDSDAGFKSEILKAVEVVTGFLKNFLITEISERLEIVQLELELPKGMEFWNSISEPIDQDLRLDFVKKMVEGMELEQVIELTQELRQDKIK
ncbi:MAG: DnaJ domain-containing protein [Candidatus Dojkabacteria bacterium]